MKIDEVIETYYYLFTEDYLMRVYPDIFSREYPFESRKWKRDAKRIDDSFEFEPYYKSGEIICNNRCYTYNISNPKYSNYIKMVSENRRYYQAEKMYLLIKDYAEKIVFFDEFVDILFNKVRDIYDAKSFFNLALQERYSLGQEQIALLASKSLDYAEFKNFLDEFSLFAPLLEKIRSLGFDDTDLLQKVLVEKYIKHYDEITDIVNDLFLSNWKFENEQIKKDILEKILSILRLFPKEFINDFWDNNKQLLDATGLYYSVPNSIYDSDEKCINDKSQMDVYSNTFEGEPEEMVFITNNEIESEELTQTEKEELRKIRIGQSKFKKQLLTIEKKCRLCGVSDERFLVASHIKPWSQSNNQERLDVNNGLLLMS